VSPFHIPSANELLRQAVGERLALALDSIGPDEDCVTLTIQVESQTTEELLDGYPYATVRTWRLAVVGGELQDATFTEATTLRSRRRPAP